MKNNPWDEKRTHRKRKEKAGERPQWKRPENPGCPLFASDGTPLQRMPRASKLLKASGLALDRGNHQRTPSTEPMTA
jgi:hypothetical protein